LPFDVEVQNIVAIEAGSAKAGESHTRAIPEPNGLLARFTEEAQALDYGLNKEIGRWNSCNPPRVMNT
jgi:hypothetical protein